MMLCLLCGRVLTPHYSLQTLLLARQFYHDAICETCSHDFERINSSTACPACYRAQTGGKLCSDCQRYQTLKIAKATNRSLFSYNSAMHDYFQAYKRHGDYRIRRVFSGSLRGALTAYSRDYLFVPIPTSREHFEKRQFDPVLGLYEGLCPMTPLLIKNGREWHQSTLERKMRLEAPQTFECVRVDWTKFRRQRILILDDIYTTGTTLLRATDALREGNFQGEIQSLTLAR